MTDQTIITLNFHNDGGHGWLECGRELITSTGIASDISEYSYQRGNNVYLEEDCDLNKFYKAYVATTGRDPKHTVIYSERCRIRNYARYTPEKAYRYIAGGLS